MIKLSLVPCTSQINPHSVQDPSTPPFLLSEGPKVPQCCQLESATADICYMAAVYVPAMAFKSLGCYYNYHVQHSQSHHALDAMTLLGLLEKGREMGDIQTLPLTLPSVNIQ